MTHVELLKDEYKTPLAMVRGVFLCEDVADTLVSTRGNIRQEDWDPSDNLDIGTGVSDPQGNINLIYV
jgi:hypothetical protein